MNQKQIEKQKIKINKLLDKARQSDEKQKEKAVSKLCSMLKHRDEDMVCLGAEAFAMLDNIELVPHLIAAYKVHANNRKVRNKIMEALGKIGRREAAEFLISLMDSEDEDICAYASMYAGVTQYYSVAELLKEKIVNGNNAKIANHAAMGLRKTYDKKTIQSTARKIMTDISLSRVEGEELYNAVSVLGYLNYKEAADSLYRVFTNASNEDYIRNQAAISLGYIGDSRATEHLIKLSHSLAYESEAKLALQVLMGL